MLTVGHVYRSSTPLDDSVVAGRDLFVSSKSAVTVDECDCWKGAISSLRHTSRGIGARAVLTEKETLSVGGFGFA